MSRRNHPWGPVAALIPILLGGCFSPQYGSGDLLCSVPDRRCPEGFHCAFDGRCWRDGEDPSNGLPGSTFWIGSGGSVTGKNGRQINISLGDTCVAGTSAAASPDGGSVTFGLFSTNPLESP